MKCSSEPSGDVGAWDTGTGVDTGDRRADPDIEDNSAPMVRHRLMSDLRRARFSGSRTNSSSSIPGECEELEVGEALIIGMVTLSKARSMRVIHSFSILYLVCLRCVSSDESW